MKKNVILEKQTDYINNSFNEKITASTFLTDVKSAISSSIQKLVDIAFKPSFKYNKSVRFDQEEQRKELSNIVLDMNVINETLNYLNSEVSDEYNRIQDFKTKSKNELNKLKSYIRQVEFMNGSNNTEIFVNTFNNYDDIDLSTADIDEINVMTSEGIATLPISNQEDLTDSFSVGAQVSTNGQLGNYSIIEKSDQHNNSIDIEYSNEYYFCSDIDARDNTAHLVDNESNTWLEIQSFNEPLKAEIKLDLGRQTFVNWIDISPYIPKASRYSFTVETIKYRDADGMLKNVYPEDYINKEVGLSFSSNGLNKYFEQGVFTFDPVSANQIIIYLRQDNAYNVKIGEYKYYQKINDDYCIITESQAPDEVQEGEEGIYYIKSFIDVEDGGKIINKEVMDVYKKEVTLKEESARYFIGIRDIKLKYNTYSNYSEIISKPYKAKNNIKRIKLNTIEDMPDAFINQNVLRYFISVDENEWHEIRPDNRINKLEDVVPMLYELESTLDSTVQALNVNTGYIKNPSDTVRLKIVFSVTDKNGARTPVLEEYALIVEEDVE